MRRTDHPIPAPRRRVARDVSAPPPLSPPARLTPPSPRSPAGGSFEIEIAANRAFTTLAYGGNNTSPWGDGQQHPDNYSIQNLGGGRSTTTECIPSPNMHTQNETRAAGTAMAISYSPNLADVRPNNTVVFSVAPNTPYRRIATYAVPAAMAPCPPGGCTCVWAWVPENCGEANIFMVPIKCRVTNATAAARPLALPARNAVWCENDQAKCVKGPKGIIINNQLEGNTVNVTGVQADDGEWAAAGYNYKMGYYPGAQNDIFAAAPAPAPAASSNSTSSAPANTRRMHRRSRLGFSPVSF